MRFNANIAGVGMTRFMKYPDKGIKELGTEAVQLAVADAGLELKDLEAAFVGNYGAGIISGQHSIRGQVILGTIGVGKIPIINVENACASGSTAFYQACAMVTSGLHDVVLALGVEKLSHPDKTKTFAAFAGGMDVDELQSMVEGLAKQAQESGDAGGAGESRSMFMVI
jgi:acetyl-CoA acetyltransferase